MSGHSKWSQIKRKKGIADQKKGHIFSKMSKIITLAVLEGGGIADPSNNVKLRLAIDRAKVENMPKENIERAIEKAKGADAQSLREVVYEGFAPGGISLMMAGSTDNPNRTHSTVKTTLEKHGGKMGAQNSVAYLFDKCGVVVFDKAQSNEASVFSFADKSEALDIEDADNQYIVYIPFEKIGQVDKLLAGLVPVQTDIFYRPKSTVTDSDHASEKLQKIVDALEGLDDIDRIYTNLET